MSGPVVSSKEEGFGQDVKPSRAGVTLSPIHPASAWSWWYAALLIPFLGLALIGASFLQKMAPSPGGIGNPHSNVPAGEIQGAIDVGQTFKAPYPGLYRIDVMLATYARTNTEDVTFHLRQGLDAEEDLYNETVNARRIVDNAYRSFTFPPIADSADEKFYFYFESPESVPGDAITAWGHSDDPYEDGAAFVAGEATDVDLKFLAFYRPSPWNTINAVVERMAANKKGLLASKYFYLGLGAVYLGLFAAFFLLIIRYHVHPNDPRETKSPRKN